MLVASHENISYLFNHWHQSCHIISHKSPKQVSNTKHPFYATPSLLRPQFNTANGPWITSLFQGILSMQHLSSLLLSLKVILKRASYPKFTPSFIHIWQIVMQNEFIFIALWTPKTYFNSFLFLVKYSLIEIKEFCYSAKL